MGKERVAIQPEFYQRPDHHATNAHGMIVALVLLWANPNFADRNPGPFFRKTRRELFGSLRMVEIAAGAGIASGAAGGEAPGRFVASGRRRTGRSRSHT